MGGRAGWRQSEKEKMGTSVIVSTIKIKGKWIKDFNVRLKAINILEENTGSKIWGIARSSILSDISPQARETTEKINKWDYIKLKSFCTAKEIINK